MSQLRDLTTKKDLERITPSIIELVDKWQSKGKFIWSGPLSDEKTGMAIFEATEEEAEEFHEEYGKICSGILDYSLYQWESIRFSQCCKLALAGEDMSVFKRGDREE